MKDLYESLQAFLIADELRHITPLKMQSLYRDQIRISMANFGNEMGYVLTMPRAASQYDSVKYPSALHTVLTATNTNASSDLMGVVAQTILNVTRDAPFVVKTIDASLIAALREAAGGARAMHYERALCTFVPNADAKVVRGLCETNQYVIIENTTHISDAAQPLLAAHGVYSASELATMFSAGDARCWVCIVDGKAVATALTFPNAPTLHEIGSLYVRPNARRAGHAQSLLRAALDDLRERRLPVRYVVDAENVASIALAERCGLRETMRLEHWLVV
jgi:ribosomal protein S18 acetylase RimI-like enzyme